MSRKKQSIYFIQEHLHLDGHHNGGIGLHDIELILIRKGMIPLFFPGYYNHSLLSKCRRVLFLLKIIFVLKRKDICIFQFPHYAKITALLAKLLVKLRDIKIIIILSDINGLKDDDCLLMAKERTHFRRFRHFVVHNNNMKHWLIRNHPKAKVAVLGFFDFLAESATSIRKKSFDIVFAGNLSKSLFLENIDIESGSSLLRFKLYGNGFTDKMSKQKSISYMGSYLPQELPKLIKGSFGLVWDGDSGEFSKGAFGKYMQYISHHKISLYILSLMPIIIYENAGGAEIIKKMNIGILIASLSEIEGKINEISDEEYQIMRNNMAPLVEKIAKGECLLTALRQLIEFSPL